MDHQGPESFDPIPEEKTVEADFRIALDLLRSAERRGNAHASQMVVALLAALGEEYCIRKKVAEQLEQLRQAHLVARPDLPSAAAAFANPSSADR